MIFLGELFRSAPTVNIPVDLGYASFLEPSSFYLGTLVTSYVTDTTLLSKIMHNCCVSQVAPSFPISSMYISLNPLATPT